MGIRFAVPADSTALLRIYAQYIDTPITFEYVLPSEAEFAARVADISRNYPYLICEEAGQILGYAYAHRQAERAAYQWNAELSVYLDRTCTAQGLGGRLYTTLIELLKLQKIRTVYGCVTMANEPCRKLHQKLGFELLGVYHKTGYKLGQWWDVGWYEKSIAPYGGDPEPPRSIREVPPEQIARILRSWEH